MKNKSKRAYSTILSNCKRDGEIDCYSIVFVNMNIMTEGGGWSVSSVFLWGFFFFFNKYPQQIFQQRFMFPVFGNDKRVWITIR